MSLGGCNKYAPHLSALMQHYFGVGFIYWPTKSALFWSWLYILAYQINWTVLKIKMEKVALSFTLLVLFCLSCCSIIFKLAFK